MTQKRPKPEPEIDAQPRRRGPVSHHEPPRPTPTKAPPAPPERLYLLVCGHDNAIDLSCIQADRRPGSFVCDDVYEYRRETARTATDARRLKSAIAALRAIATLQRRGDSFAEAAELQRLAREAIEIDEHDKRSA